MPFTVSSGRTPRHRSDNPVSVGLRGRFRVDVEREQAGGSRDCCWFVVANFESEYLSEIRSRIGAD